LERASRKAAPAESCSRSRPRWGGALASACASFAPPAANAPPPLFSHPPSLLIPDGPTADLDTRDDGIDSASPAVRRQWPDHTRAIVAESSAWPLAQRRPISRRTDALQRRPPACTAASWDPLRGCAWAPGRPGPLVHGADMPAPVPGAARMALTDHMVALQAANGRANGVSWAGARIIDTDPRRALCRRLPRHFVPSAASTDQPSAAPRCASLFAGVRLAGRQAERMSGL